MACAHCCCGLLVRTSRLSWCAKLSCESFAIGVLSAAMWGSEEHHSPAAVANVNKGSEKMETDDYARRWENSLGCGCAGSLTAPCPTGSALVSGNPEAESRKS